MKRKSLKTVLATLVCLGALTQSALAGFSISIDVDQPPPSPRYEAAPPARPGWVWVPGFWYWEGHRHIWREGRWERPRPGHHWVAPRWEDRGGRHHFEPGRWERDHDWDRDRDRDRDHGRDDHPGRGRGHGRDGAPGHNKY